MKRLIRPAIIILLSIALALMSAALTQSIQPREDSTLAAAAFFLQTTPTPEQVDRSEVGSTDGIVVMGFLLVVIVILPILLRRKAWAQPQ
jgi:cytochrome c1